MRTAVSRISACLSLPTCTPPGMQACEVHSHSPVLGDGACQANAQPSAPRLLRRFTLTGIPGQYSSSARVEYNEMKNQGKPPTFRQLQLASSDNQVSIMSAFPYMHWLQIHAHRHASSSILVANMRGRMHQIGLSRAVSGLMPHLCILCRTLLNIIQARHMAAGRCGCAGCGSHHQPGQAHSAHRCAPQGTHTQRHLWASPHLLLSSRSCPWCSDNQFISRAAHDRVLLDKCANLTGPECAECVC